ncbi:MAG: coproporphyrinogen oxidase [Oscillospiraceae bacterium]|nr:coproporphyrinogen oxidase [Oscillospiraceae bacterium]
MGNSGYKITVDFQNWFVTFTALKSVGKCNKIREIEKGGSNVAQALGIYLHIPFCKSKCAYCDFYSLPGQEARMDDYCRALAAHMEETAAVAGGHVVDTVYFGGGTPSLLGSKRLRMLLDLLRKHYHVAKTCEITLEANPDSVNKKLVKRLRRAGVNRISIGMQSARDSELEALGRPHRFAQVVQAVEAIRSAKIKNLSLDLMYGLPGQEMEDWRDTLERAIELQPEHLSCYGLKVEEGTALASRVEAGELLPDDDLQADMYLCAVKRLEEAGYRQYEISNFAKPGFESRHNLKYWTGGEYAGFGAGAHSDFGGRRYAFVRDLEQYIRRVAQGETVVSEEELIPHDRRWGEYLMLRLRTTQGIEGTEYRRDFRMNFDPLEQKLEEFEARGLSIRENGRWRLTPGGFLLSNQIIGTLLECQEEATLADTLAKIRRERTT